MMRDMEFILSAMVGWLIGTVLGVILIMVLL